MVRWCSVLGMGCVRMRELWRAAVVWNTGGRQPKMSEWEWVGWGREIHTRSLSTFYGVVTSVCAWQSGVWRVLRGQIDLG